MSTNEELIAELEAAHERLLGIPRHPEAGTVSLYSRAAAALRDTEAENTRLTEGVKSFMRAVDALQAKLDAVNTYVGELTGYIGRGTIVVYAPVVCTRLTAILNGEEPNNE